MRIWRLSFLAVLLAATAACHDSKTPQDAKGEPPQAPVAPPTTELVSLAWKPASANQNLQSFDLKLTGADVVSVCHTPPGWILEKAGAAWVNGYATVGAGFISADDLKDLDGLFLIRTHPGETLGVRGKLLTGLYADDGGQSEIAAIPALLRREPAEQCPQPKS